MTAAPAGTLEPPGRPAPGAAGARLAELFDAHARMVVAVCRLQLRDPVEAEDAAQQTFLSAYRALLSGTVPREPGAWLSTIARNECRARVRARTATVELPEDRAIQTDGAEDVAVRREQLAALYAALAELPQRQREAVVLRDVYGLRHGEVGAALGVSRASVESLLFRARRRLRMRLRPAAATAIVVPLALREAVAQAVPGFAAAPAGAAGVAAVGGGVLAKLGAAPLAAKVAAVSVAVGGTATVLAVERPPPAGDGPGPSSPALSALAAEEWPAPPPGTQRVPPRAVARQPARTGEARRPERERQAVRAVAPQARAAGPPPAAPQHEGRDDGQATLGTGRHADARDEHEEPSGPHRDGGRQPAPAREHAEDGERNEPVEDGEPGDGVDSEQGGDAAEVEAPPEAKDPPEEPDPETGIEDGLEAGLDEEPADPAEEPDPGA